MPYKKEIKVVKKVLGSVYMPGSKSITNRALIIGALANGTTYLKNALFSDDTNYMQKALLQLGIDIVVDRKLCAIKINGCGARLKAPTKPIYLGNAGTAMRFLSSFVALGHGDFILTGNKRMHERPIGDLVCALKMLGANIAYLENEDSPPLLIKANLLNGGSTKLAGNLSSQYLSSILLCAPYAKTDVDISIIGNLISKPYIDITVDIMRDFGVECLRKAYKHFLVKGNQLYKPREYLVEGDASNASYFFAAAAITKGVVRVYNIDFANTKQGDIKFLLLLQEMGCDFKIGPNWIELSNNKTLTGIEVDMGDISDVVQTLAVVALFAKGTTHIKNIFNMRIKETDRIKALYNELTKLGATVHEGKDSITIIPKKQYNPASIETYDDHRMAMAFALVGLKVKNIVINNPSCVTKTFPEYFDYLEKLS